jgi:hypothetical protein
LNPDINPAETRIDATAEVERLRELVNDAHKFAAFLFAVGHGPLAADAADWIYRFSKLRDAADTIGGES